MNYYRLNTVLTALLRAVEDGGELTDEQLAQVECLSTKDIPRAVDNLCRMLRETNLAALASRQEAQWFALRARQQEDAHERFKGYLLNMLKTAKIEDISTDLFTVRVNASPPSVVVAADFDPEKLIGTEFEGLIKTVRSLAKDAVKARWGDNPEALPPGVTVERGSHVKITPR